MPTTPRLLRPALISAVCLLGLPCRAPAADHHAANGGKSKAFIYKLTASDRLRVVVFGEPELSAISRIDANGNINLYLVGDVHVAGLTVNQAQTTIEEAYHNGRYLRNPKVTVSVEEYAPRTVTVDGQVKNPGTVSLPVESTLTVYQAIMRAGGFTDVAKGSAVTVTRVMPDGTKRVFKVDVSSLIKGKDHSKKDDNTLQLQPGDIIYVPESLI